MKFEVVTKNTSLESTVQVLLMDPVSTDVLKPLPCTMEGDAIKIETKPQSHFKKYRTKISLMSRVKGDPEFDCKHYTEKDPYSKCVEEELVSKLHSLLGCHPPLISTERELLCDKTFHFGTENNVTKETIELLKVITNDYESSSCKRPCRKFVFKTQELYENTRSGVENAVTIVFAKRVEHIKISFLLSIPSLLTGLGGAVSSGQTLMWIIVSILGFIAAVKSVNQ